MLQLGLQVFTYSLYSLGIVASDGNLFRPLMDSVNEKCGIFQAVSFWRGVICLEI